MSTTATVILVYHVPSATPGLQEMKTQAEAHERRNTSIEETWLFQDVERGWGWGWVGVGVSRFLILAVFVKTSFGVL